jgi:hypothetical protein
MLKTYLAQGHSSRELAARPCAYSNMCEQCDNFVAGAEFEARPPQPVG